MAIVPRRLQSGKTAYWVTFDWNGKTKWERAGTDERSAERLEAQRKAEVLGGTYNPEAKGRVLVRTWFDVYFAKRTNRTLENDRALVANHVLCAERSWFASMPITKVRPRHTLRLVEEIRADGKLGEKSLATVYGIVRGAFRRALFDEVIADDPTVLPRGEIRWKSARGNRRKPYTRAESRSLTGAAELLPDQQVWNALAFFTGMREGEICGRRWRDWSRDWEPLSALNVWTQYEDQPLKTDDAEDTHPRLVPVHPELEQRLRWWWSEGFELVHRRKPEPDDFIVPNRAGECHTKSSAYKMFQRGLAKLGVENRTLHATRHTFISVARSNGAPKDVLERVTHNARGETIDDYTTFEWRALCEAVAVFDLDLDPKRLAASFRAPAPGLESGTPDGSERETTEESGNQRKQSAPRKLAEIIPIDALFDANQRRLLKFGQVDAKGAAPGIALLVSKRAALDGGDPLPSLRKAGEALGLVDPPLLRSPWGEG